MDAEHCGPFPREDEESKTEEDSYPRDSRVGGELIFGPQPVKVFPVALVLGPGLARGYAHAGVLRTLHDNKIPVGAVLGVEMGALIGAIFATSRTINEFEWKLFKFTAGMDI